MKIKVFKFEVCNYSSHPCSGDEKTSWYHEGLNSLADPDDIAYTLNRFCADKEIIDIKINAVDVHYHNNARDNTVELWYTVMYK